MDNTYSLQIAVCEDNPADAALLESHIEKSGIPSARRGFDDGEAFLRSFRAGLYDLVFLDIYMGGMNGIEVAKAIRETDEYVVIAFTTTSPDHTLESYRLGALKYLEKPVTADGVRETMELALFKRKSRSFITLTMSGGKRADIALDSVLYFELKDHVIKIHTSAGLLTTSQSVRIDDIEKRLPSPPFMRCHRSYMVNLNYVHTVDRELQAFIMKNGDRADIRRGHAAKYLKELDKWRLHEVGRDGI